MGLTRLATIASFAGVRHSLVLNCLVPLTVENVQLKLDHRRDFAIVAIKAIRNPAVQLAGQIDGAQAVADARLAILAQRLVGHILAMLRRPFDGHADGFIDLGEMGCAQRGDQLFHVRTLRALLGVGLADSPRPWRPRPATGWPLFQCAKRSRCAVRRGPTPFGILAGFPKIPVDSVIRSCPKQQHRRNLEKVATRCDTSTY
jgi:hypothetical protein